jgi:hypothetical protein
MKWGTILVPNTSDALSAIMMYSLFRGLSHLGGAEAAGVKPPRAFRFFEYFYSVGKIPFF